MKLSIIIPTLNRYITLEKLIHSVSFQKVEPHEVIIVDQNRDDRVSLIVESYRDKLNIKHIKFDIANLSAARNAGYSMSTGDLLFFPDDDSQIPPDFTHKVISLITNNPQIDFVSVPIVPGREKYREADLPKLIPITVKNANKLTTGSAIVFKRASMRKTGLFDSDLGLGGKFESSEDLDIVLRMIYQNLKGYLFTGTCIIHEDPLKKYDDEAAERAYRYNRGYGACAKKHMVRYGKYGLMGEVAVSCVKNAAGALLLLLLDSGRAKYNFYSLRGKLEGFVKYGRK